MCDIEGKKKEIGEVCKRRGRERKREKERRVIESEREGRRSLREGRNCLKSVFWKYQKHDMNWKGKQKIWYLILEIESEMKVKKMRRKKLEERRT